MGMTSYSQFDSYKERIFGLSNTFHAEEIVTDDFLLEKSDAKKVSIYYSPVEYLNEAAIILIVGITPGFRQMKKAYESVCENRGIRHDEEILHKAKMDSGYEGPMRKNLIQMLDQLGLHTYLQLSTSGELFTRAANHLMHTTGLLPYPVFYKGKNYTGTTPNIWKTPILRKYVLECFREDVSRLDNPLIIPLGVNVANVLQQLTDLRLLGNSHLLTGFPHPSGANGHRHKQFASNKEQMQNMIAHYFRGP